MSDTMLIDISKYRKIPFEHRDACMICGRKSDSLVIELPNLPMTEIYTREVVKENVAVADQGFNLCSRCGHGQLTNVIDVGLQYGETFSYFFRAAESATARESASFFLQFMNRVLGNSVFQHAVELGCNDLYLLKQLQNRASRLTGIDPILKDNCDDLSGTNITTIADFFENVELKSDYDLVICKDTLEHVENPKAFTSRIVERASDNTLFFFQFPCLESILRDCRFDQVFHQHLNYFTIQSIIYMLHDIDCELVDYTINFEHWGAILIAFRKGKDHGHFSSAIWPISSEIVRERYNTFKANMAVTSQRLYFLRDEKIYGYGAALMLPVLNYYLDNAISRLECIIDEDPRKKGLYYINLPVRIESWDRMADARQSVFLITAVASMNNIRTMLPKLFALRPKHIIVPLNTI